METVVTTISPNYVKGWERKQAIREVMQNCLDAKNEFFVETAIECDGKMAVVRDYGPGIELRHLAMGISEKGETSIGQFGEGLKLAALVYARNGWLFTIRTKNLLIRPTIVRHSSLETDVLAFELENGQPMLQGVEVTLESTPEELDEAKELFLELSKVSYVDNDEHALLPPGRLFVNGQLVHSQPSVFSWNIDNKEATNRDRDIVSIDTLMSSIRDYIRETESEQVIRDLLKNAAPESSTFLESRMWFWVDFHKQLTNRPLWEKVIKELYGDKPCISVDHEADGTAEWMGYKVIRFNYSWRTLLKGFMPTSTDIAAQTLRKNREAPFISLEPHELKSFYAVLKRVNKILKDLRLETIDQSVIKVVEGLKKGESRTSGLYDPETHIIYLDRRIVGNPYQLASTLIHECDHRFTGASDLSEAFVRFLQDVIASQIVSTIR